MPIKSLSEWLSWLETAHTKPIDFGLERIQVVFNRLFPTGVPFKVISVAGTNGKGSTVAALEAIYSHAGVVVGAYTSPHIECFNERIRIKSREVVDHPIIEAFEAVHGACAGTSLTYFEYSLLAALYVFKKQEVELAILEVGLGGRLDAVNVVDADLSVITNIALDHTEYLGDTREKIAKEKAGIMRLGKPVVIGDPKPPSTIISEAEKHGVSAVYIQGHDYSYDASCEQLGLWSWRANKRVIDSIPQTSINTQNAATAVMTVTAFDDLFHVSSKTIQQALGGINIRGRQEVWSASPDIILDVAHNPQATESLAAMVTQCDEKKTYALVGLCEDKDIEASLAPLKPIVDEWHLVPLPVSRGAEPQVISSCLDESSNKIYIYQSIEDGFLSLFEKLGAHERLLIFGSFYLLGPAYGMLRKTEKSAELM